MLTALLTSMISAFVPAAIDGVKVLATGLANRVTGGAAARPSSFAEALQWKQADIEQLKALATLDNGGGTPSLWVVNLRQSCRYLAAYAILAMCVFTIVASIWIPISDDIVGWIGTMANSVMFFLFGDRVYANLKGQR